MAQRFLHFVVFIAIACAVNPGQSQIDEERIGFQFHTNETRGCRPVDAWHIENTLVPHLEVNFTCGADEYHTTKFCPKSFCWKPKTKEPIYTESQTNFYAVQEVLTEKMIKFVIDRVDYRKAMFLTTACRCVEIRR